jgi:hypothetical protein
MLKSIATKLAGVSAAIALIGAASAAPASALKARPCSLTGPQITAASGTINGSCFRAGESFWLMYSGNGKYVYEPVTASAYGGFSAPVKYAGYNATETVVAIESGVGAFSNTLTIAEP